MRIHSIAHASRANGPGRRSVLWTQGCDLACPGCWNPKSHSPDGGTAIIDPDALAELILHDMPAGTTGITISGGEPMQQAVAVYAFICSIKARRPDLSIGMFSGYTITELRCGDFTTTGLSYDTHGIRAALWDAQIRPHLDWAIMGRFDRTKPVAAMRTDLPWRHAVSSANQTLHLFSRRYDYTDFPPLLVEIGIEHGGLTTITGFPI